MHLERRAQFPYCRCNRGKVNNPYDLIFNSSRLLRDGTIRSCFRVAQILSCGGLKDRAKSCCESTLKDFRKLELEAGEISDPANPHLAATEPHLAVPKAAGRLI
ncbi:hypothetical protein VOLCADRAFT_91173 [Volvox carteri f. nagariensis]|uniref:Pherophorin domain-containing protein n=1 Tax=Volvox carteri f. nagariensis TaxID=3068 RepID=D8TWD4_VOLCA|nr:uncharacterized protein VOLCADRAFT_91173 [Volvox carteri f. nagariensis]EFJ48135.1 hypothetical protein VOLCADRAFT_91173 [Volvox carteri f. nagariensis]|eukprot:XP_002950820.1 hypothetical protein VOLCADRAFT_91173 [Volvox carteri f. nagariensis]